MRHFLLTVTLLIFVLFARCGKEDEIKPQAPMTVKNYEGHIHIGYFSKDGNMQISFYPCGVNQLFGIAKVCYYATLNNHYQDLASVSYNSSTDWIGPYQVCCAPSIQSGIVRKFTGGWHGGNGDGTGTPTASTIEVNMAVDGENLTGNFERNCNQVDLIVTNLIQGYDFSLTNKTLLKEIVRYNIKNNRQIDVQVTIEALEDLVIQRYYGLQSQNFALFDSVKYLADLRAINGDLINVNSSCRSNDGVNTILLTDNEKQHQLKLVLNLEEGLGLGNLGVGTPRAFSASYRKSYFNLVNGIDLNLKKGEKVFWKGAWFWD
jgi:hypothetical protein